VRLTSLLATAAGISGACAAAYVGLVTGRLTLDRTDQMVLAAHYTPVGNG